MTFVCLFSFWLTAATARNIHQYMNAKDLNLTIQHVASHLQVGDRFSLPQLWYCRYINRHYVRFLLNFVCLIDDHK